MLLRAAREAHTTAPNKTEPYNRFPHGFPIVGKGTAMASFYKTATGWRAQIARKGMRASKVFKTKAEAQAWATVEEARVLKEAAGGFPDKTLTEAMERYEREVSQHKRGARAEGLRFQALQREMPDLCGKLLHQITPADIGAWRDARRAKVSDASVLREAATLRNLWTVAENEWGWCGTSPWKKVKLPLEGHARTRRTDWQETKRLLRHMGYVTGKPPVTPQQQVAWAYLVAHHTALRAGEVRGLSRSTVDLVQRVVTLHTHKTLEREGKRWVPVTRKAARVLAVLDAAAKEAGRDAYFTISAQSLDVLFRKVRDRLLIDDLHFHDSRAAALTRLSRRMDVMRLARISGHRDLSQLLRAYYRESPRDIAASI